jgi:hypothetical protein
VVPPIAMFFLYSPLHIYLSNRCDASHFSAEHVGGQYIYPLSSQFSTHMVEDTDRPAALLTNAQRAYLRGEREYSSSAERDVKQRIRDRVTESIKDFSLLFEHWHQEEREKVFTPSDDNRGEFEDGLIDLLALIYMEQSVMSPSFEVLIRRAVIRGERQFARSEDFDVHVDLDVDVLSPRDSSLEEIGELIRRGKIDEVDERDLRTFLKKYRDSGELDPEVPHRYLQSKMDEYIEKHADHIERRQRERREKQGRKEGMRRSDQS